MGYGPNEPDGPYECLYDLEKDPAEWVNLASNPEYAPILDRMKARLAEVIQSVPEAEKM